MAEYDWAELKEQVKNFALSSGIDKIGFTDTRPLTEHLSRLLSRQEVPYRFRIKEGRPHRRIDPATHLPGAATVISAALAYPHPDLKPADPERRGRISLISRGTDYHVVMRARLERLGEYLRTLIPEAGIQILADREEILEKALAVKAGLGWFGRNHLLVTPEFGSWVCLGEIVTDLPFPPDHPLERGCGNCRRCIEACPTGALQEGRDLNLDRCLACTTLIKTLPSPEMRSKAGNRLYGCDTCQLACPSNQQVNLPNHPEFASSPEEAYPLLSELLNMNKADYQARFGHTSAAWRGRTLIQRNAVIAAGNLRNISAEPDLIKLLTDSRPVIRSAAAWALGRMGRPEGFQALRERLEQEPDREVRQEIEWALENDRETAGRLK